MLYQVTHWTPMKHERGLEVTGQWIVGSRRQAELEAKLLLPPASETTYSARWGRHPFIEVTPVKRFCPMAGGREYRAVGKPVCFETPIVYVPSVGDLGWTP